MVRSEVSITWELKHSRGFIMEPRPEEKIASCLPNRPNPGQGSSMPLITARSAPRPPRTGGWITPINDVGNREGRLMVDRFASAWTNFAKNGVPNSDLTPDWTPYDLDKRATMVFDINTRVEIDYRREFRLLWDELGGGNLMGQ